MKQKSPKSGLLIFAEEKGFEPLIPFRIYTLSRRASSTTPALLLFGLKVAKIINFHEITKSTPGAPRRKLSEADPDTG